MNDPIERQIARLQLPEPTPSLDRRIGELLTARRKAPRAGRKRGVAVVALAGGALAAGILGVVLSWPPQPDTVEAVPIAHPVPPSPMAATVEVTIPDLELSANRAVNDRERILTPGAIVISTSIQSGVEE